MKTSYPPVLTKRDFSSRFVANEFGNRTPTWETPDELLEYGRRFPRSSPVPGLYHLRNRVPGGKTYYNLQWSACVAAWLGQPDRGGWYVGQMIPPEVERTLRLQGEVRRAPWGLDLTYTRVKKPMRDALRERTETASGIIALELLRGSLGARDYDWLEVLLDRYDEHVVEFSSYGIEYGTLPGYSTVYWEVRAY